MLTKTLNNEALQLGKCHLFLGTDLDAALGAGWRYMGKTTGDTLVTRGEQRLGIETELIEGAQVKEYAAAPHIRVRTALASFSKENLAETRPGSTATVVGQDIVSVGIGKNAHTDITSTLPTLLIIPEWCDLGGMAGDMSHEDWEFAVFIWRAVFEEQDSISFQTDGTSSIPVSVRGTHGKTPPGMVEALPKEFRLYYVGNPKHPYIADVDNDHVLEAIGLAIVFPDFAALVDTFEPETLIAEEMDVWYGDLFTPGAVEYMGRLRGVRNLTFRTLVRGIMHEDYGESPLGVRVVGAEAGVECSAQELNRDLYLRILEKATVSETDVPATIGFGAGDAELKRIDTPRGVVLRPASAQDASNDIVIFHAVPDGDLEEPLRRSTREMAIRFVGRVITTDDAIDGYLVAGWGDVAQAVPALEYEN